MRLKIWLLRLEHLVIDCGLDFGLAYEPSAFERRRRVVGWDVRCLLAFYVTNRAEDIDGDFDKKGTIVLLLRSASRP